MSDDRIYPGAMHDLIANGRYEEGKRRGGQEMAARLMFGPQEGHMLFDMRCNVRVTLEWVDGEPPRELIESYCKSMGVEVST